MTLHAEKQIDEMEAFGERFHWHPYLIFFQLNLNNIRKIKKIEKVKAMNKV